jgi:hypothetical protein
LNQDQVVQLVKDDTTASITNSGSSGRPRASSASGATGNSNAAAHQAEIEGVSQGDFLIARRLQQQQQSGLPPSNPKTKPNLSLNLNGISSSSPKGSGGVKKFSPRTQSQPLINSVQVNSSSTAPPSSGVSSSFTSIMRKGKSNRNLGMNAIGTAASGYHSSDHSSDSTSPQSAGSGTKSRFRSFLSSAFKM